MGSGLVEDRVTNTIESAERGVGDALKRRGERVSVAVPVFTDLDGSEVCLRVQVVAGRQTGKTVALIAGSHGDEWQTAELIHATLETLDPEQMTGNVVAAPIINPVAYASRRRNAHDDSDSPDMNRSYGVEQAWIANQLAKAVVDNIFAHAEALVDYHCGIWGSNWGCVVAGTDFPSEEVNRKSFQLARSFGYPYIQLGGFVSRFPGPTSSAAYAGAKLGIPPIVVEVGGAGFEPRLEASWISSCVEGTRGVLSHLGILDVPGPALDKAFVYSRSARVSATQGGMLEPAIGPEELWTKEVQQGELLGTVWSPHTFEVIDELRAPFHGLVSMVSRAYPVRPGSWAFMVADLDHADSRWIGAEESP
jgi:predicted deacylase